MVWCPLDDEAIGAMLAVAEGSWERDGIDRTWCTAGWCPSAAKPVSQLVFDELEDTHGAGERIVRLGMRFDPDVIVGIRSAFATFTDGTDDRRIEELVASVASAPTWRIDRAAARDRFDAVWRAGCRAVADRLGPPTTGRLGAQWQYAVWRLGDSLLTVHQGEDVESSGTMDAASIGVVRYPREHEVPAGPELSALICG
jgi:hypothetical protein